jgi:peptidoglycan/LPS O-acetylase OafA/YrhL
METLHEPLEETRLDPQPTSPEPAYFDFSWFTTERIIRIVEIAVVVLATGFVLGQLGLGNILSDTTPAGGDMGAHVWGPAFLRDHLLNHGRLSGWTPDWYAGFPAYQFYMVLPALMIVVLNAGLHGWAALLPLAASTGIAVLAYRRPPRSSARRTLVATALVVAVLGIGLPYGTAFKIVTVLGLLTLPVAAYALARLADLPFPTPPLFALSTVVFLFNREPISGGTGNIIGGNVTSTLAGEFSFSLSLTFGVLFLGVMIAGFRTGRYRWLAAVLLALTALCHVIVGIFVVIAAAAALAVWPGWARAKWLAAALPVGGLLSAFWTFPFVARSEYVNDMGWEKLPSGTGAHSWNYLVGQLITDGHFRHQIFHDYLAPPSLHWVLALAIVGVVVSIVLRIRAGMWLGLVSLIMALAFVLTPESRLWNARLLPFYYLTLCLLAALGIAELARAVALLVARDPDRPVNSVNIGVTAIALIAVIIVVGLPLKALPGETTDGDGFHWQPQLLGFSLPLPAITTVAPANPAPDWARWNYTGYENKPAYPEYYNLVTTMQRVGHDEGCGRAMWEYDDPRLERYGTPMAPMLLSLWTDGCIGSMEGLYFESSTTTPFHFINQDEMSTKCSCAQRNLPYRGFDLALGIKHMQLLGVRYYLASTAQAVDAAAKQPELREIATAGSDVSTAGQVSSAAWHVYEIADTALVTPLTNEPAVVTTHNSGLDWTYGTSDPHTAPKDDKGRVIQANGPAMSWYLDPARWNVFLAASGPSTWARVKDGETPPTRPLDPVTVTGTATGTDSIDFDVDRVGVPVLVKASYFPNWKVDGAQGPFRVTPNLMVVVPTSKHVHLHYATTGVEYIAYALTLLGIALAILLARRAAVAMPEPRAASGDLLSRILEPRPSPDEEETSYA